jgi:anti-anti-sigma regulatory factor
MTLKIEAASAGEAAVLRLVGRIQSDDVDELRASMRRQRARVVLDLDEVTLVDLEVVDFLVACEGEGVELLHCSPYIREWMGRERHRDE